MVDLIVDHSAWLCIEPLNHVTNCINCFCVKCRLIM